ncbi:MAG: NAD(+)/NADH kinase [Candidatus Borkfalkiaceae bacterium]|nr:NAD(+)/NADH kinase [Christensenellaceae bacterium]
MTALIYTNAYKDPDCVYTKKLIKRLNANCVETKIFNECGDDIDKCDVLFVIGGDGTILDVKNCALKHNLPIIGINAGKLGFLTEFEREETEFAADCFANKTLKTDKRICCSIKIGDKEVNALNEISIQRVCDGNKKNCLVTDLAVYINGDKLENLTGDGVIVSTPTGSTAYSLASGGAVLTPDVNAFSVVPICAHSIFAKPIVCSSECVIKIENVGKPDAGIFADGEFVSFLSTGERVVVKKNSSSLTFLRKENYNFLTRLIKKLGERF